MSVSCIVTNCAGAPNLSDSNPRDVFFLSLQINLTRRLVSFLFINKLPNDVTVNVEYFTLKEIGVGFENILMIR